MDFSSPYAGPGFKTIFYHCTEQLHAALWKLLTQRLESWVANHSAVISSAWNWIIESSDELPRAKAQGLSTGTAWPFWPFSGLGLLLHRLVLVHWCNRSVFKEKLLICYCTPGFLYITFSFCYCALPRH